MSDATMPTSPPGVSSRGRSGRGADVVVFIAATVIAAGFAVALNLHVGLPAPIAFSAALALHLALFLLHLRVGRASSATGRPAAPRRRAPGGPRAGAARQHGATEPRLPHFAEPVAPMRSQPDPRMFDPRAAKFETDAPPPPAAEAPVNRTAAPAKRAAHPAQPVQPDPLPIAAPPPATAAAFDEILRDLARTLETHGRKDVESIEEVPTLSLKRAAAGETATEGGPQDDLIARSVAALRVAGDAMQAYDSKADQKASKASAPTAGPRTAAGNVARTPSQVVLGEIANAIEQEQLELAVSPILGLSDQRLHHKELVMRLKTTSGDVLVPQGIPSAARGTGLVPLLDALKAGRAVSAAAAFEATGEGGLVFARATGEGLLSKRLVRALAGEPGHMPAMANRVVLTFVQQEVRSFGHAQWTTLSDLASQGFRFAVEDVTALDLDFQALRGVGFAFAKIEARLFLSGLQVRDNLVGPAEVHRILAGAGITLIIDRIDDESLLAPVGSFGIALGQGAVFGRPRVLPSGGRSAA